MLVIPYNFSVNYIGKLNMDRDYQLISLCQKCPSAELFLVPIFLYSVQIQKNADHFSSSIFFFIFISFLARCIKFNKVLRRHCLIISSTVPLICFHLTSVGNGGCNYYVTINFCGGLSLKVKRNLLNKTCHKNRSKTFNLY